jgi:hypothetical protein
MISICSFCTVLGRNCSQVATVFIRDVSPNRVSRAFLGFWGPQCGVRASKFSSRTFPTIEFPGHSWGSGVSNVLYGPRSLHPGRFPESSFPGILGILGPQCVLRASKCSSGTFPRIEFPWHSWVSGVPNVLHARASKCSSGTFPRIEFPVHSCISRVPNVMCGLRNVHPGRFPESSFPGILGVFLSPMCCTGLEVFIRDVGSNRISWAFLGFWGPQGVVRASKYSSWTFPRIEFPGHS